MTDDLVKIRQLQALADLKLNTELARLKAIAQEKDVPNAILDKISKEKIRSIEMSKSDFTQSMVSGMDANWHIWVEQKTRSAMSDLARIAQRQEAQMIVAKQAFGRTEALKSLAKKLENK